MAMFSCYSLLLFWLNMFCLQVISPEQLVFANGLVLTCVVPSKNNLENMWELQREVLNRVPPVEIEN